MYHRADSSVFRDRRDAGRRLADRLSAHATDPSVIVLGLPRGGIPVAYEVAQALGAPLDAFVVRKLGAPGYEELAVGAIASGGSITLVEETIRALGVTREALARIVAVERAELERREREYRGSRPFPALRDRTVILVDDGVATGATMHAAASAIRQSAPRLLIAAAPVMSRQAFTTLRSVADECEAILVPHGFGSVGLYYDDFSQTTDDEVRELLRDTTNRAANGAMNHIVRTT